MIIKEEPRKQHQAGEVELTEIVRFFVYILKEFLMLQKRFPKVHLYIDSAEPVPFLVIELNYDKLKKEDKDFLFGFGYRLNKALKTAFGEDAPFVEVNILNKVREGENLTKIV